MYKVVFLDIDGTIVPKGKKVSPLTKEAVKRLKEKGITVVLATGRPLYLAKPIADELNIKTYICHNGGKVVCKGKVLHEETFNVDVLQSIEKLSSEYHHPCLLFSDHVGYAQMKHDFFIRYLFWKERLTPPVIRYKREHTELAYSAFIYCKNEEQRKKYDKLNDVSILQWRKNAIEISPTNRSKAKGAKILLDHLGLKKEEAIAFGDQVNDMDLFRFVGCSVAMGDAYEPLKDIATLVTEQSKEDGVYQGLKKLQLL